MSLASFEKIPPLQVWVFDPLTEQRASIGDILALFGRFDRKINIIPTGGGKSFAIYSEDPAVAAALENWMRTFAPTADYRMMHPEAISN